jgi:hypothetical protein
MSALTNYDRWKGIGDEEDAEDRRSQPPRPVVTRLDANTTGVTIGSDGWSVTRTGHAKFDVTPASKPEPAKPTRGGIDYSKWDAFDESDGEGEPNRYVEDDVEAARVERWKAEALLEKPAPPPASKNPVVDATRDGGFATRDGRICAVWSQTADEVTARFPVGASTRAHNVRCALQYKDGCVLTVNELTAQLKHDVWCVDDPRPSFRLAPSHDEDALKDSFDWCLEDSVIPLPKDCRCVCVSLKKRPVAHGVVTWWSTLFAESASIDETPRDTTSLESRTKRRAGTPEEFQAAWAGAHEQFLEKVKNHPPPVEVELPDEG